MRCFLFLVLSVFFVSTGFAVDFSKTKAAAEQGDPVAQTGLGTFHQMGWLGAPKDPKKAFEWYKKAADQGYAPAIRGMGRCYENGIGVTKNDQKAFECYKKAADMSLHFFAQTDVARCYAKGIGVCQNGAKALEIYHKLADAGDRDGLYYLGACYYDGIGVPKDAVTAYAYFNASAAMDDDLAKEFREAVEKEMTPSQIAEAQKLSTDLFEKCKEEKRKTEEYIEKILQKKVTDRPEGHP